MIRGYADPLGKYDGIAVAQLADALGVRAHIAARTDMQGSKLWSKRAAECVDGGAVRRTDEKNALRVAGCEP